jgi:hypothetical protein
MLIFETRTRDVAERLRKIHDEELYNLYSPANIIRLVKSTGAKGKGHLISVGFVRNICDVSDRMSEEKIVL